MFSVYLYYYTHKKPSSLFDRSLHCLLIPRYQSTQVYQFTGNSILKLKWHLYCLRVQRMREILVLSVIHHTIQIRHHDQIWYCDIKGKEKQELY